MPDVAIHRARFIVEVSASSSSEVIGEAQRETEVVPRPRRDTRDWRAIAEHVVARLESECDLVELELRAERTVASSARAIGECRGLVRVRARTEAEAEERLQIPACAKRLNHAKLGSHTVCENADVLVESRVLVVRGRPA